jgi:hypothetical protein
VACCRVTFTFNYRTGLCTVPVPSSVAQIICFVCCVVNMLLVLTSQMATLAMLAEGKVTCDNEVMIIWQEIRQSITWKPVRVIRKKKCSAIIF